MDDTFFCAPGTWKLYACTACGSGYLNPRPTRESIQNAYRDYYTHTDPKPATADFQLTRAHYVQRALANGYRNWRYGCDFTPSSKLGILAAMMLPGYREIVHREFRHIPRLVAGSRLLDVGAGDGEFLARVSGAGWVSVGVEPDATARAVAQQRGLDVRDGNIETLLGDEPERFDVITLNHVIEHAHDPRQMMASAYSLLRPGGCLYIDTPNINSLGHRQFGRHWRGLEAPRHIVLFNWSSLLSLLNEAGFRRVTRWPQSHIYLSLAAASRAISKGLDPTPASTNSINDYLLAAWTKVKTPIWHNDSEFVTVTAFKPNDA
ncbi:MAG TPA: class I SAM-dependent methyltransferase [Gammaproteobacteria bacterium]|nr:class I SAM-dependent methyltransferase [Gammaproteobacteria bacterium]